MGAIGTAALAFATTNTASAAAMLALDVLRLDEGNKPSALGACIGAVVGLVAITPAAGYVTIRESIVIGVVASVVSNLAVHWKTEVDPRRHARRLPLPRRRRDDRHGDDRNFRQGRRLDLRKVRDVSLSPPGPGHRRRVRLRRLVAAVQDHRLDHPAARDAEQETIGLDLSQHGETAMARICWAAAHANGNGNGVVHRADLVAEMS